MNKVPFCKFCGQLVSANVPDDADENVLQEIGTEHCSCWEAEKYRKRKMQVSQAKIEISALLQSEDKTRGIKKVDKKVVELLNTAADLMGEGIIHKISVNITGGGTANITIGSSGKISVQRSVQFKEKREVE